MATESEKAPDEKFCTSCGATIKKEAEVCPECGVRQSGGSTGGTPEKSPGISAVASLLFPGVGDIYNGEFGRGAVIFVAWFIGGLVWGLLIGVVGAVIGDRHAVGDQ
ncbi:MAG: hypothetical protein ACOCR0_00975, partial [Haloferacaceae archaeon]